MAYLMVSHNLLFVVGEYGVLLLVSGNYYLYALFEVGLRSRAAPVSDCPECRLIYDIGKLRAGCSGCHAGHCRVIDIVFSLYF